MSKFFWILIKLLFVNYLIPPQITGQNIFLLLNPQPKIFLNYRG